MRRMRLGEQRHPAPRASLPSAGRGARSPRLGHRLEEQPVGKGDNTHREPSGRAHPTNTPQTTLPPSPPAEGDCKPGRYIFKPHQGFKEGREGERGVEEGKGKRGEKEKGGKEKAAPSPLYSHIPPGPFPVGPGRLAEPPPGDRGPRPRHRPSRPCGRTARPRTDPTMETSAAATIR